MEEKKEVWLMEQNLHNSPVLSYFLTLVKMTARFWIKINYLIVVNEQSGQINL